MLKQRHDLKFLLMQNHKCVVIKLYFCGHFMCMIFFIPGLLVFFAVKLQYNYDVVVVNDFLWMLSSVIYSEIKE